jgi:hypothetical protein
MLTVEVTETITCTPDELLGFVMDAGLEHRARG